MTKIDEEFLVTILLLDEHNDAIHLKATNDQLIDWLKLSGDHPETINQAKINQDNIEEIFKDVKKMKMSLVYKVPKKDLTNGGERERGNYIQSWESMQEI